MFHKPLIRLLESLSQRPIDVVHTTAHNGPHGPISRSQADPIQTQLLSPFNFMICQFNRDNTELVWRASDWQVQTHLYHGNLPYHTQAGLCFQYVIKGEISKMMMGHAVRLYEGDCCLIDMNCVHAELADTCDAVLFSMELRRDFFLPEMFQSDSVVDHFIQESLQGQDHMNRYLIIRDLSHPERLERTIDLLLTFEISRGPGQLNIGRGMVEKMFWYLDGSCTPQIHSSDSSPRQDIVFFELARYVQSHLATVTIQELTALFHYDRNYFNRLIKNKTGLTYTQYVRQMRLEEAKRLLIETKLPVQDICQQIGYENRSFFYRIFEKETGLAPLEYRQKQP